jgi:hypothetical protein
MKRFGRGEQIPAPISLWLPDGSIASGFHSWFELNPAAIRLMRRKRLWACFYTWPDVKCAWRLCRKFPRKKIEAASIDSPSSALPFLCCRWKVFAISEGGLGFHHKRSSVSGCHSPRAISSLIVSMLSRRTLMECGSDLSNATIRRRRRGQNKGQCQQCSRAIRWVHAGGYHRDCRSFLLVASPLFACRVKFYFSNTAGTFCRIPLCPTSFSMSLSSVGRKSVKFS